MTVQLSSVNTMHRPVTNVQWTDGDSIMPTADHTVCSSIFRLQLA